MTDAMEELSERFVAEAGQTTAEIMQLVEQLASEDDPAQSCEQIRKHAHDLRGAAGMFGFADLKARAAELEEEASAQSAAADGETAAGHLRVVAEEVRSVLPPE